MFVRLTARHFAIATVSLLALASVIGAGTAVAQDGASPRAVPEGFVVPGPAPTSSSDTGAKSGRRPATASRLARIAAKVAGMRAAR